MGRQLARQEFAFGPGGAGVEAALERDGRDQQRTVAAEGARGANRVGLSGQDEEIGVALRAGTLTVDVAAKFRELPAAEQRRAMGLRARTAVLERYSHPRLVRDIVTLYDGLVRR